MFEKVGKIKRCKVCHHGYFRLCDYCYGGKAEREEKRWGNVPAGIPSSQLITFKYRTLNQLMEEYGFSYAKTVWIMELASKHRNNM